MLSVFVGFILGRNRRCFPFLLRFGGGQKRRVIIRFAKHLQQLLALEAVAIGLNCALVRDIATWEESGNVNAQASKELCVENAVTIVGDVLQAIY